MIAWLDGEAGAEVVIIAIDELSCVGDAEDDDTTAEDTLPTAVVVEGIVEVVEGVAAAVLEDTPVPMGTFWRGKKARSTPEADVAVSSENRAQKLGNMACDECIVILNMPIKTGRIVEDQLRTIKE